MDCKEVQCLLHGYLDDELDVVHCLTIEQHLQDCATCARAYEGYQRLRVALKEYPLAYQAPPALYKRVRLAFPPSLQKPRAFRRISWPWLEVAALLLLLVGSFIFWTFMQVRATPTADSRLTQAIIESHERSLLDDHLVDLSSSDPRVLKAWFETKLGYAPPVINLTMQGFVLVGGRLDFLENQAVAAIVYRCAKHVINLYVWPTQQYAGLRTFSLQGYYLTHWTGYGMDCWAIADLNQGQLQQFVHLINLHIETLV